MRLCIRCASSTCDFGGRPQAIGVYVVDTSDGPGALRLRPDVDAAGPAKPASRSRGSSCRDVRHLLLSHIHLDHAGAAGAIVRRHPELTVWVSAIGAPHLVDPSRLERSARRLYGDGFDELWGELAPVPQANVRVADGDVLGWESFPTRGHASHHVSYFRDGTLLAGDAAGVRMPGASYVRPGLAAARHRRRGAGTRPSHAIRAREPERLALIHFGVHEDVDAHLDRLDTELDRWAARVGTGWTRTSSSRPPGPTSGADADVYDQVAPFWQSWHGLRRYWDKRR